MITHKFEYTPASPDNPFHQVRLRFIDSQGKFIMGHACNVHALSWREDTKELVEQQLFAYVSQFIDFEKEEPNIKWWLMNAEVNSN